MTQDKYEAEKAWIEAQDKHFDYISDCVLDSFYADECMEQLQNGYDIVCRVNDKMLALDHVVATSIVGMASTIAKQLHDETGKPFVVIPCDSNRSIEWRVK